MPADRYRENRVMLIVAAVAGLTGAALLAFVSCATVPWYAAPLQVKRPIIVSAAPDFPYSKALDEAISDTNFAVGCQVLKRGPVGQIVVVMGVPNGPDDTGIASAARTGPSSVVIRIKRSLPSIQERPVVLGHELGHALGLDDEPAFYMPPRPEIVKGADLRFAYTPSIMAINVYQYADPEDLRFRPRLTMQAARALNIVYCR